METLTQRVQGLRPSATLAIVSKARAMKKEGIDVVGFGAGEPDFDTPQHIKDAACRAIQEGFTKYTPVGGIDELKDAVIEKFKRRNAVRYNRSEIIISCGGKHALYNIGQALFQEGDEVIIPSPYWVSYPPIITLAGATPVIVPTSEDEDFKVSIKELSMAITPKTKALVLNTPSNPTGAVYTREELKEIAQLILKKDLFLISDEIYEEFVYDGLSSVCVASLGEDIKEKTIVVNGVSKTYSMTGWRIGYAAGPEAIISAMTRVQSQTTSNPNSIAQKASIAALNGSQDVVNQMVKELDKRRKAIVFSLNRIKGIRCPVPEGAFYVFPDVSGLLNRSYKGKVIASTSDLAGFLLEEAKVAVVPGEAFGCNGHIRISYAISMEEIEKGVARIEKAVHINKPPGN